MLSLQLKIIYPEYFPWKFGRISTKYPIMMSLPGSVI